MLKKLLINGKKIPVPVPIHNLSDAVAWIEKHLLRPDHTITRITLDGRDIDLGNDDVLRVPALALTPESDMRCKIDSPMEICIQTIDALRNLSTAIGRNLKPVAVHLWEYKGSRISVEARAVIEDVRLMIELLDHILILIDRRIDITNVNSMRESIEKAHRAIQVAESHSDWKGLARVLLQQLEQPTLELSHELSSLQKTIYEAQADRNWERRAQASNG
jgi:hypothetical protein